MKSRERMNGEFISNGIDRIDNNRGYVKENCVPCCKTCNYAKRKMDLLTFKEWARRLYDTLWA